MSTIQEFEKLLCEKQIVGIEKFWNDKEQNAELLKNASGLVSVLSKFLTKGSFRNSRDVYDISEKILVDVSEKVSPDLIFFDLIEHAEESDCKKFSAMLKAIQNTIFFDEFQENFSSWTLNTILYHVYDLSPPDDAKYEEDEAPLSDNDAAMFDINETYSALVEFCGLLMGRATDELKGQLLKTLLKPLGRPLICTDVESRSSKSAIRLHAEEILELIFGLKPDILSFLEYADCDSGEGSEAFVECSYVRSSLAGFYYLVFCEELGVNHLPHVYSPLYVVENVLGLSLVLMQYSHSFAQRKGLRLALRVLERIPDRAVIYERANYDVYGKLLETVAGMMVYNEVKSLRRAAVDVFRGVLLKFNAKGRYVIISTIQDYLPQSNFVGYIATVAKDLVRDALDESHPDHRFFTGKPLRDLISKFSKLEDGPETDLTNSADRITCTLNLIRFLVIRDADNVSGVWDMVDQLRDKYLEPLISAIELSRAHFNLKKKNVSEEGEKLAVSVGGVELPQMSEEEQIRAIDSSLNIFDVIESLVCRVNECIEMRKK